VVRAAFLGRQPAGHQGAARVAYVGVLLASSANLVNVDALRVGMRERAWVEGQDLVFDVRAGEGNSSDFESWFYVGTVIH
jgi:hypothetical protein